MEVAQRVKEKAGSSTPSGQGWRPGDPFPEEAFERCQAWMADVARAEGKTVIGPVEQEPVGVKG